MNQNNKISNGQPHVFEFAEFSFDASKKLLWRGAETVQLAPKACEILAALIENAPQVLSKEELMNQVWNDSFVEEANLTHHISALRKALGEDKNGRKFIETIPRKGYRFVAEVENLNHPAAEIVISERTQTRISEQVEVEKDETPLPENIVPADLISTPMLTNHKRWRKAALAVAITVALFAAVGYAVYKFVNPAPEKFAAGKTTRLTTSGRVKNAVISPDGKFVIYAQEEFDDRQTLRLKHIGSESDTEIAVPNVAEFRSLAITPDGNQLYFINENLTLFQMPILGGMPKKIAENVSSLSYVSSRNITFSPDGSQIAFVRRSADGASGLFIADANGGGERQLASFDASTALGFHPAWSPDGRVIADTATISAASNILAFQVADGTYTKILPESWEEIASLAWLPDSQSLMVTGFKFKRSIADQIWQISYPSGEAREITADSSDYYTLNLTADKNFLMAVKSEEAAHLWMMPAGDATAARQLTAGFEKHDGTSAIGWLPNGEVFYDSTSSGRETIWISQADGGKPRQVAKDAASTASSPDGRYLVYQREISETDIGLWRLNLSDGTAEKITQGIDVHPTFSPDGKWIVFIRFGDGQIALLKIPTGGGEPTAICKEVVLNPAISPDGKTIAVTSKLLVKLVRFEGGEFIRKFNVKVDPQEILNVKKLQWTADGRGIYFIARTNGVSNIWRQPVDGSSPVQVTNFTDGRIFNFAFSPDESQIALSRGTFNSDVVLIENAR